MLSGMQIHSFRIGSIQSSQLQKIYPVEPLLFTLKAVKLVSNQKKSGHISACMSYHHKKRS